MDPIIFSDVNGVVAVEASGTVFDKFKRAKVGYGYITYSPAVVEFFNAHPQNIRWLTTWGSQAQTRIAPALGISEEIEVQPDTIGKGMTSYFTEPSVNPGNWWKINEVIMALDAKPQRKIAWIDDNLLPEAKHALEEKYGDRVLLICTNPSEGITDADIETLENFLKG